MNEMIDSIVTDIITFNCYSLNELLVDQFVFYEIDFFKKEITHLKEMCDPKNVFESGVSNLDISKCFHLTGLINIYLPFLVTKIGVSCR